MSRGQDSQSAAGRRDLATHGSAGYSPCNFTFGAEERGLRYRLISGDNHIDLTYCPPDLWSSQAPAKWKLLVPRVEELEDGLHWFVEGQDQGMWNGVGPRFLKYQAGVFRHVDEMKASGFEWDSRRGAHPRQPPRSFGWRTWTETGSTRRSSMGA